MLADLNLSGLSGTCNTLSMLVITPVLQPYMKAEISEETQFKTIGFGGFWIVCRGQLVFGFFIWLSVCMCVRNSVHLGPIFMPPFEKGGHIVLHMSVSRYVGLP